MSRVGAPRGVQGCDGTAARRYGRYGGAAEASLRETGPFRAPLSGRSAESVAVQNRTRDRETERPDRSAVSNGPTTETTRCWTLGWPSGLVLCLMEVPPPLALVARDVPTAADAGKTLYPPAL